MPAEKYHKEYLETQLGPEIREHMRTDNLDPTQMPTYEYLRAKGFKPRSLSSAIKRHFGDNMTLHTFLQDFGFGYQGDGDWPTTHKETIKLLNGFWDSRKDRNEDKDTTISTMESSLRCVLQTTQDLHNVDNLLRYARYDSEQERLRCNREIEEVLDKLKDEKSGGGAANYTRYLNYFYQYADIHADINQNPVDEVINQYDYDTTPERNVQPPDREEIQTLWEVLKQLPERRDLSPSIQNLATRHGLTDWQIQMMLLMLLGVGVGLRSSEYVRCQCREHWILDEDPHVRIPVRKNLPGQVPIMISSEFFDAYIEYMETTREDWNGKPFPSSDSESGSRTTDTLNNWLAALCDEAGVRLEDGDDPTLQNIRQIWHEEYKKILRKNNVQVKIVADEQGTKNEQQVKQSYNTEAEMRDSIRDLARRDFVELLPLSELPDAMSEIIGDQQYFDRQTELSGF